MNEELERRIHSMSRETKAARLQELLGKYGVHDPTQLSGDNPPDHQDREYITEWEEIGLLQQLLGYSSPRSSTNTGGI